MKRVQTEVEPAGEGGGAVTKHSHDGFRFVAISLGGSGDAGIPIAAARAGFLGLLDLSVGFEPLRATEQVERLQRLGRGRVGVILSASDEAIFEAVVPRLREGDTAVIAIDVREAVASRVAAVRGRAGSVGCVLYSAVDVRLAEEAGADFVLVKGNEAGGRVSDLTSFVFLQQVLRDCALPVIAWGGIGPSTAAACCVAGAAGVALDWQLSLLKESPLSDAMKARIRRMDGSECPAVHFGDDLYVRLYHQPSFSAYPAFTQIAGEVGTDAPAERMAAAWRRPPDSERLEDQAWLAGQDACLAACVAAEFPSVGRYLSSLRREVNRLTEAAAAAGTLATGSPMARALGTTYPVIQGPMTRVSDVPEFCEAISDGGGLPFLALALIRGPGVREMMTGTRELMGDRPWGVGILGFVPKALRDEQLAVVEEIRPPFAVIAGGRPDQAAWLEARGIATFLHVPSPGMLRAFVQEGARRFIFEGAECGGHVGPRSSFVLWESMVRVLVDAGLPEAEAAAVEVFFAGGIHDAVSAAMAATVAQPLVDLGMKFGVVMGTAYLFTEEAVATGAIVPEFQTVALHSGKTVLVETGPGHAIRCAPTPFYESFERRKRQLREEGVPPAEIREQLERSNMGRLRVASKAIARATDPASGKVEYVTVDLSGQQRDGMYMIGQVAALHDKVLTIRALHESVFDGAQARFVALAEHPQVDLVPPERGPDPFDVAIVGMSCLLPGGATNVDRFWENILAKRDVVEEVPAHRFDASLWFDEDRNARDRIYSKWGGFIEDLPFDPLKYGIPPSALRSIEPMQLLALELVDQALLHAGYRDDNPYRARTSVILGAGGGAAELGAQYAFRSKLPQYAKQIDPALLDQLPEWTEDSFAGILLNVIAGRVTNRFDLGGCNFTVDAACASSLAAVYLGCKELTSRTSDMVICGGCDTIQSPFGYLCFSKTGALSPRGRSRSFDAGADGIAISEGHAAVVLKRREDAERDGDTIYAVIRGAAGGSDGKSMGLTAPRLEGQLRTLQRAYAQAQFSPATVGLFEAHATGTSVGDQTECKAITRLLDEHGARPASAGIGGVKSMIGHTKCAAGTVGLIKTALALYHRVLPPTLHVEEPNPKAGLSGGPLYVNTEVRPWVRGHYPRRAGVSAFGFGGSNFHAVLEEYQDEIVPRNQHTPLRMRSAELFAFAANSEQELADRVRDLANELRASQAGGFPDDLCDIAIRHFTRTSGDKGGVRAAAVAGHPQELLARLDALLVCLQEANANESLVLPHGVFYEKKPLGADTPLAFLFPGQGAQYPDMMRELAVDFQEVSDALGRGDRALRGDFDRPLSQFVLPPPMFTSEDRTRAAEALRSTDITQPALGVCSVGMLRLLASFGIRPAMTAGQSYGELVALHAAGCLEEDALYRLSAARGKAIVESVRLSTSTDMGQMLAVWASESDTLALIEGRSDVWIANINSPSQSVLSGTTKGIEEITPVFAKAGISHKRIPVSCAFHSPIMAPAQEQFARALDQTEFTAGDIPAYSNTTARSYVGTPAEIRETLARQLVNEVRFSEEVRNMYDDGARIFVEVGPNKLLSSFVQQSLEDRPHAAITTNDKHTPAVTRFLMGLAELYAHGVPMSLDRLYRNRESGAPASTNDAEQHAHLWMVNGSYARPASEPPHRMRPDFTIVSSRESRAMTPDSYAHAHPQPLPTPAGSADPAAGIPPASGMDPQAYAAFQQTMREFLRTQASVMQAFLGHPATPPVEAPPVGPSPTPVPMASPPAAAPAQLDPVPVPQPAVASVSAEQVLRSIVAERTGYPDDMLDSTADLEADLGIDSIKRVEIIAAFRRQTLPGMQEPPPEFMEKMTSASSMNDILRVVDAFADSSGSGPSPAVSGAEPPRDLRTTLVDLVADRTGYPTDMLDEAANLEADLGIDSIKRVEIIAAFRREILPGMQEPPPEFMERMTEALSMSDILRVVEDYVDVPAAGAPATTVFAAPSRDLESILIDLVADRTGYPTDMLDPAANLEADLGIDSIKRVEIIAAFRREILPGMQEPPPDFMERMTEALSMRDILGVVQEYVAAPPSAPAASAPVPVREPLDKTLIGLVADRTGYPPDMLDEAANLEADLGIDSIKRVEIIAAFRREVLPEMQEPPSDFMERMSEAQSIRDILSVVEDFLGAPSPQERPAAIAPVPAPTGSDGCPRCVVRVIPEVQNSGATSVPPVGHWLLTDDGDGLAPSVAAALEAAGSTAEILPAASLDSRETAEAAVAGARVSMALVGLIHLVPLQSAAAFPGISFTEWEARCRMEVTGLLHLLQALAPELTGSGFHAIAVSRGGGDFAPDDAGECAHPWRGGIAGLIKVADLEWPDATFHHLDVSGRIEASDVIHQAACTGGPAEVGLRDGSRVTLQVVRREHGAGGNGADGSVVLTPSDRVLVLGGARGITAEVICHMARHVPCTYVLLGRSPLPDGTEDPQTAGESDPIALRRILVDAARAAGRKPVPREIDQAASRLLAAREIRQTLKRLDEAGATAEYHVCDAADPESLTRVVREVSEAGGDITALVHGAGVIDDKYIADKTTASFERVVSTKVQPLLTLTGILHPEAMKLVVLFSSVAGYFGNAGQGDYAAANEMLNRIGRRLADHWAARVVALNWGPWAGAGMVTEEVARQFRQRGVGLIGVEAGCEAAWQEMTHAPHDGVRILLGPGEWVDKAEAAAPASRVAVETPLLAGQRVTMRSENAIEARVELNADTFRYLRDHQIDEKPVLPFAVAMEMMIELAAAARPELHVVRVEDIQQFKGIILESGPRDILISAYAEESDLGMALWQVSISDPAMPNRKRYQARVRMTASLPSPPEVEDQEPINNGFPLSVSEAYHQWLFHGASYQLITELGGLSKAGIDARLNPSDVRLAVSPQVSGHWLMDPIVLDVGPQIAILWARGHFDTTPLPYRIAALERYGPIGKEPVACQFRASPESTGSNLQAEVRFIQQGRLVGRMIGLECAGSAELNRITGKSLALR